MIIKNAAISPGQSRDLQFLDGRITRIAAELQPEAGEDIVDAGHRVLLPGLHDHHMHFLAYAASLGSVDCSHAALQKRDALAVHLASRLPKPGGSLRAIGYHEGDEALIDRHWLDKISDTVAIRVQHRTGRLWIYNSTAISALGLDSSANATRSLPEGVESDEQGQLTGRFYHVDDWLRQHSPRSLPDIELASYTLASYGVTGFTDAGPDNDNDSRLLLKTAQQDGQLLQRVLLMGQASLNFSDDDFMQLGACKIYLKESALPDFDELCIHIKTQHARNRPVAFHCVTLTELHVALAALGECGSHRGDRIEHASLCDDDALAIIKALDITVVSQTNFIAERGDRYLATVATDEQRLLYRAKAFFEAGIPYAGSTDAPFGNANPWLCMQAAMQRATPSGEILNAEEALSVEQALNLFADEPAKPGGARRQLKVGEQADCCLLNAGWASVGTLATAQIPEVCATWIAGELVYQSATLTV